ncbi:MAG: hypothetical protein ABWZ53_12840 [Actinomycetota bacterium]
MTLSARLSSFLKNLLLLLAIVGALVVAIGVLSLLRTSACDRLDAERVAHLEPGHDTPGPGSINVIGVGPGPPKSQIIEYLEAESAMMQAGCEVPDPVGKR